MTGCCRCGEQFKQRKHGLALHYCVPCRKETRQAILSTPITLPQGHQGKWTNYESTGPTSEIWINNKYCNPIEWLDECEEGMKKWAKEK